MRGKNVRYKHQNKVKKLFKSWTLPYRKRFPQEQNNYTKLRLKNKFHTYNAYLCLLYKAYTKKITEK